MLAVSRIHQISEVNVNMGPLIPLICFPADPQLGLDPFGYFHNLWDIFFWRDQVQGKPEEMNREWSHARVIDNPDNGLI